MTTTEPRKDAMETLEAIPNQAPVPWEVAFAVSWGSLKRRFFRSLITMTGVILAIAFLTYMLVNDAVTRALVGANVDALNLLLQKADVDIFATGPDSRMILLIGLSLFTCLVGIVNSMLMSVTERIREIGTMKCLGALDSFILKIYFIEASLQGILGTLLGLAIGLVVGVLVTTHAFGTYVFRYFPVLMTLKAVGVALVVGSLISIAAAIAPAYWAATKQPVDAMRAEE
jgi:ABC-type lipoprotein release transport system permease subunit